MTTEFNGLTGQVHRVEVDHWVAQGALKPVTVKKGDVVLVTVQENSSTGYLWSHRAVNLELLKSIATDPDPERTVGGSNFRTFAFKANGSDTLHLTYQRPWETIRANKNLTMEVVVE